MRQAGATGSPDAKSVEWVPARDLTQDVLELAFNLLI